MKKYFDSPWALYKNIYFFKEKLRLDEVTDFGNSLFYKENIKNKNSINLLVFADGISFRKSKSSSMVSMLSSITEMPPLLRASYENIISHFLICHSSPDLNHFFEMNQNELFSVFKEPIFLPRLNLKVQVNIIAIVADLIEIPKLLNVMQFNAKDGSCLQCFIKPTTVIKCINKKS